MPGDDVTTLKGMDDVTRSSRKRMSHKEKKESASFSCQQSDG